ncbi:MAG: hypothetical protein KAI24_07520 [Planctomycetes bacterium]|nr:hypothetical protein [Planctomycetota bacterium]
MLLSAAVAASLPAALSAQMVESRGVLAGSPTALFVDGTDPAGNADGTTLVHRSGFSQSAPLTFGAGSLAPDLRAILTAAGSPTTIDLDDFSTGRDELLIDANGVLDVDPEQWSVWSFSLRDGAAGAPGSLIEQQALEGGLGAAVFSYVLPGSGLPAPLVGRTQRSHSVRDLGLSSSSPVEVDGLDLPLVLGIDQSLGLTGGAPTTEPGFAGLVGTQAIYFTVSHATRDFVPGAWWGNTSRSGATILCVQPSPFGGSWGQPQVFLSYAELGLGQDEDIDALAVDAANEKVLFSVVGNLRDQLLFVDFSTDGANPVPVTTPSGTRVSDEIGKAQNDDVDAVCALDPDLEGANLPSPGGDDFGNSCGEPRLGLLGTPELSGSAFRSFDGATTRFESWLVGWPAATGPAPSLAFAFLTSEDNLDPVLIGGLLLRDPFDVIPGNPQANSLLVPPSLSLTGSRFTIRWFHLDWASAALSEAWPVQIYL